VPYCRTALRRLAECGLLKASLVAPTPIRDLRDLTHYRSTFTAERQVRGEIGIERLYPDLAGAVGTACTGPVHFIRLRLRPTSIRSPPCDDRNGRSRSSPR
jgi:hypothetical protein